jgi:hypothetical protein
MAEHGNNFVLCWLVLMFEVVLGFFIVTYYWFEFVFAMVIVNLI